MTEYRWRAVNFAADLCVPFQTPEDLEKYLSGVDLGTRIACLLCGQAFKGLTSHLWLVHGTTARAYRAHFEIPQKRALASPSSRSRLSHAARHRLATKPELLRQMKDRVKSFTHGKQTGRSPVVASDRLKRIRAARAVELDATRRHEISVRVSAWWASHPEAKAAAAARGKLLLSNAEFQAKVQAGRRK